MPETKGYREERAVLRAGAASRDITPDLKGDFFGYVRPDLRARGVALRLHAHALVLDDGTSTIGVLTLDLGAPLITRGVLERVADLGFDLSNLIIAATHTHAGPNKPGEWAAQQAAAALRAAYDGRRPAQAAWGRTHLRDANRSRSLEAHLANHGLDLYPGTATDDLDPQGVDHPRDINVRVLRVEEEDGSPLAAWGHFSAHPTTFIPANTYFSADYPGAATHHFRAGFARPPVAVVTNGTEGDLITRYDEVNSHALADRIGHRVATAMRRAWEDAADTSAEFAVGGATEQIRYEGQEVAPGERVASRAWFGLPFIGGGQNGPSFFYGLGLEGRRRPRWLADRVHGRKIRAAPAPWSPHADVTVLRAGDTLLLSVPGEPTVETGRHMVATAIDAAGPTITDALVVGLAQAYRGYFTTPEEYDQQHYEGGHTVFGKFTSRLVQQTHARLARRLGSDEVSAAATPPAGASSRHPRPADREEVVAPVGRARRSPRIVEQPPRRVQRFETIRFSWTGPRRGRGRPVDAPLLVLERHDGGTWTAVEDDLGVGFAWRQRGRRCTARHEIAGDLPEGRYRVAIHGGPSPAATDEFEVVASTGLRPIEATALDGGLLVRAQFPAPDPTVCLRRRDQFATGGRLRCRIGSSEVELDWDDERAGWFDPDVDAGTDIEVPAGGLVDGAGNRNGRPARLQVGQPADLRWPAYLGPGGGRAPGLFGLGPAGAPARR